MISNGCKCFTLPGALTATEVAQAKAALLARLSDDSPGSDPNELRDQLDGIRLQNKLLQLDQF